MSRRTEPSDRDCLGNQRGQGLVEYMLLLVLVVLVGLGVVYKFNSAFSAFAQNYFVNYLGCLIESGELPALGSASISSGQCQGEYQAFDPAAGRPLVNGGNGGGASSGDSSPPNNPTNPPGRPASQSSRGQSGGSANGEAGGQKSASSPAVQTRPSSQSVRRRQNASSYGSAGSRRTRRVQASRRNPGGFRFRLRGAKDRKASRTIAKSKRLADSIALRKSVLKKDLTPKPGPPPAELDTDLGVSKLLRLLLILGIIIAIVIFLGSQIMQLKKSWEKPDAQ